MKSFCLHITADVSKTEMRQTEHYLYYECSVIIRLSFFPKVFTFWNVVSFTKVLLVSQKRHNYEDEAVAKIESTTF